MLDAVLSARDTWVTSGDWSVSLLSGSDLGETQT